MNAGNPRNPYDFAGQNGEVATIEVRAIDAGGTSLSTYLAHFSVPRHDNLCLESLGGSSGPPSLGLDRLFEDDEFLVADVGARVWLVRRLTKEEIPFYKPYMDLEEAS